MKVLVCNAGSTSLKFKFYEMPECKLYAQGHVERVGSEDDAIFHYKNVINGAAVELEKQCIPGYKEGIRMFLARLTDAKEGVISDITEIERVGFKTVLSKGHFGVHELDEETMQGMRDWLSLAPVHNTAYLAAIETMREVLPEAKFVGVFETAFHQTIPMERKLFGLPYEWYETYGVQRLGYHGASHGYIADTLNELTKKEGKDTYRAISCHLGGSCSICAIKDGKSADTSFGMSLESGVIHANRVGDMDSSILYFLEREGLSREEILQGCQKKGGLLGISGVSNDCRYVLEAAEKGDERAKLARDVFVTNIAHYIGSFFVDLGGLDFLVFTAGIGEHSDEIRRQVCEKCACLGIELDEAAYEAACRVESGEAAEISAKNSSVRVLVIPTNEEIGIARRTYEFED